MGYEIEKIENKELEQKEIQLPGEQDKFVQPQKSNKKLIIFICIIFFLISLLVVILFINNIKLKKIDIPSRSISNSNTQILKNNKAISSNEISISPSKSSLKSDFFSNDPDANELIDKNLKRDLRVFTDDPNQINSTTSNSKDLFEYKLISALRMLGMTRPNSIPQGKYFGEVILNKFQKLHNLEESPFISSDTLRIIDSELSIREKKDKELASQFPLFNKFTESPSNQPTKQHIAALYTIAFKALPDKLVKWNNIWFENYLKAQFPGLLVNATSDNWKICTGGYLVFGIANPCGETAQLYPGKTADSSSQNDNVPIADELSLVDTLIHEYGHFIDKNVYPNNDIGIDTTGFYEISFKDFDPKSYPGPDEMDKYYRRPRLQNRDEFISGYASGNNFKEDFADSFSMYVMQGKMFRKLAKRNEYINQKYAWLKKNVFNNMEYNTGTENDSVSYLEMGHPVDYSLFDPDFYFNFEFKKL